MQRKIPIFYSALLLTGVNLLLRLVGTSFQVYLSGRIGAAGIGLLQLVMSVGSMAMVAGIGGIRTATMYLTAEELGRKHPQHISHILKCCFGYSLLFSCTVGCILHVAAPWLAANWIGDIRSLPALRLIARFLPITCLCGVMTGYFTAANRILTLAAVEVAEQLCAMVLTMTLLILWAGNDPGRACFCVVLGSALGSVFTIICLMILRLREVKYPKVKIPVLRRLTQTALPLALADDLKTGISTTENLMVPKRLALHTGTASPLAAFGMISGMVFPIIMFPAAILFGLAELLIPELARCNAAGSKGRIHYLVQRSLRIAMIYGLVFSGILFLVAQPLCAALYGNGDAAVFLQLYALLIPMLYCDTITDAMAKGLGQQKICVRYNILTALLDVIGLYLLLPRYGMTGYFISFFITHLINFMLSLRLLLRITNQIIAPADPMLGLASMIFGVWVCSHAVNPIVQAGAYLIILVCCLFLCKILRKEDILWLKGLICKT